MKVLFDYIFFYFILKAQTYKKTTLMNKTKPRSNIHDTDLDQVHKKIKDQMITHKRFEMFTLFLKKFFNILKLLIKYLIKDNSYPC